MSDPFSDVPEALRALRCAVERRYGVTVRRVALYVDQDPEPMSLLVPQNCPGTSEGRSDAPSRPRPRTEPEGCAGDILRVLRETATRLTCPQILDEFAERNIEWSERSVKRWLAWLTEHGWVDNDERANPPGYGLTGT